MKINLVMIVKNEERCLKRCLESAKPIVDRMIVLDTGSEDRTREIAREIGAEVYEYEWQNDFSAARNAALEYSDADYNLILDADEWLQPCNRKELEQEIMTYEKEGKKGWVGCMLQLEYFEENGKKEGSHFWLPRLLPKGVRYQGAIHEQPAANGPLLPVLLRSEHDGYLREDKGERNLGYLQAAVEQHPEDPYYQFQLAATLRNLKRYEESLPYFKAFYQGKERKSGYWVQGVVLYLYALIEAGGAYLENAKAVIDEETPYLSGYADFCFVCGLFYMHYVLFDTKANIAYLPKIEQCYLACLEIGERPEHGGVVGCGSFKAAYNLGLWYELSGQKEKAEKLKKISFHNVEKSL